MEKQPLAKTIKNTQRWCQTLISACYGAAFIYIASHIIWYIFFGETISLEKTNYIRKHLIIQPIVMLSVNVFAHILIKSSKVPLKVKRYIAPMVIMFFSSYLSFHYKYFISILSTFIFPVFASVVFVDKKFTNRISLISFVLLILSGLQMAFLRNNILGNRIWMELLGNAAIFIISFLLANVLINFGQDSIMKLMISYSDQEHMKEQLKKDQFTNLYNKKYFNELLPKLIDDCKITGNCLSLAIIDIDFFKKINDLHGHFEGDKVILKISQVLNSIATENTYAFRIGGEEFALIFKDTCINEAYYICEGIRSLVEASSNQKNSINVTISCGISCIDEKRCDKEYLFKAADKALYQAKNSGKNKVIMYNDPFLCDKRVK